MKSNNNAHSRVKARTLASNQDVFGPWTPLCAFASKKEPIPNAVHSRAMVRLERSYRDITQAARPELESWRAMTDVCNFLQSLHELGWSESAGELANEVKAALEYAVHEYEDDGCLRLRERDASTLRHALNEYERLVPTISAHSYWLAVKTTKLRVFQVLRGGKRPGDVVVAI